MKTIYNLSILTISIMMAACTEEDTATRQAVPIGFSTNVIELENKQLTRNGETIASIGKVRKMENCRNPLYIHMTSVNNINRYKTEGNAAEESRGRIVTTNEFHDDYALWMYEYDTSTTWAVTGAPAGTGLTPTIHREKILRTRAWMTNEFWPGPAKKVSFFAYAPYDVSGLSYSSSTYQGTPYIHYNNNNSNTKSQKDLLVCGNETDVAGNYDAIKPLVFDHVLTGIRFAIGDKIAPCKITRIELRNVYGEADLVMGDNQWTNLSTTRTYNMSDTYEIKEGEKNRAITDGENIFMMIPQTCPDGAKLAITVNDGESHTLETNISGDEWRMGSTVTYVLTTAETLGGYQLYVQKPTETIDLWGGEGTYKISSYKQSYYGSQTSVPWKATYTVDDDPTEYDASNFAVSTYTPMGNGGTDYSSYTINIKQQIPFIDAINNPHTKKLRERPSQSGDLSQGGETANCYVINAPGNYTLPLVYGNARNNPSSYASASFVDHFGVQIQGPNIYDYYTPSDAILVWQDAPKLITPSSVQLTSDKHAIQFSVEQDHICEGNAVIAVRDANETIMWSWHIWVTDWDVNSDSIISYQNRSDDYPVTCQFMYLPLGFCHADNRECPERHIKLKVVQQVEGGDSAFIDITQQAGVMLLGDTAPYYEWGRKDPMLPNTGKANKDKPYYDTEYTFQKVGSAKVASGITAPFTYYRGGGDWNDQHPKDLWNASNDINNETRNNKTIIKTIYDPSPRGFKVPVASTFIGTEYNYIRNTDSPRGFWFYSQGSQNGMPIFFYKLGYRNTSGDLSAWDTSGEYWTGGHWNDGNAPHLEFYSGNSIREYHCESKSYGFNVRCIKE